MIYHIYHIPEKPKIGLSKYPKSRVRSQGYSNYEILESHNDIEVASHREIELQKEYGYLVDTSLYYKSVRNNLTQEARINGGRNSNISEYSSKGGKIGGTTNKESGHMSRLGSSWKGKKQKIITCPHCNKSGGNAMKRWHFDNCKNKI